MNKNSKDGNKLEKKHICEECGASFLRPYRLTQHLLLHNNIKTFVCGEKDCDKSYTSKSHLDRHINTVHIKPNFDIIYRCPECMKVFSNRQNLKRHIKIKHVKKVTFTCDVCKSTFKKKHLLSTHMYYHTYVKSFSCVFCNKEFISILERKKHMKNHKTYSCEHCEMAFDHWSKYIKHRRSEHCVKEYNCNECGRKFKRRSHIVRHLKTHVAPLPVTPKLYTCWFEDCGRVYSRNSNLKQHIRMKHLKETHACEICGAQLANMAILKAHLQTHCKTEDIPTQVKTKLTGRKDRKDKGSTRGSEALKIAGLFVDPDIKHSEHDGFVKDEDAPTKTEDAAIKCDMTLLVDSNVVGDTPSSTHKEDIPTQVKTKLTGRTNRKDKGSTRGSEALKIAGLFVDPDIKHAEHDGFVKDEDAPTKTEDAAIKCDMTLLVDSNVVSDTPSSTHKTEIKSENLTVVIEIIKDENIPTSHEETNEWSREDS